jgi:hypothetical protein
MSSIRITPDLTHKGCQRQPFILGGKLLFVRPSSKRRHVVLQIISIPLDFAPGSRGFIPLTRRIVSICILVDDGHQIARHSFHEQNERLVLKAFWARIKPYDAIIGQHGVESDFAMLRQRTFVHGLAPETELELQALYSHDVIDIDTHSEFLAMALESGFRTPPGIPAAEEGSQRDRPAATLRTEQNWDGMGEACQSRIDAIYSRLQLIVK